MSARTLSATGLGPAPWDDAAVAEALSPRFSRSQAADAERGRVYLANHSLGRPPDAVATHVERGLSLWYGWMDGAWDEGGWLDEARDFRKLLGRLVGIGNGEVVLRPNAGHALRTVLNAFPQGRPIQIVTTRGEFDSLDFILKTYAFRERARVTWVDPEPTDPPTFREEKIADAVTDQTDLVVVSHAFFETGRFLTGLDEIVQRAHRHGAKILVDLYHSAGVVPLDFAALGADFGVGGCYKYLRGGPGAGWLALSPAVLSDESFRSLDTGWFAKEATFGYEKSEQPRWAEGGDGWMESTPPVLVPYQARAGLELVLELGVDQIRADNLDRQALLRDALRRHGASPFEPEDPHEFGAFTLLPHPRATDLVKALKGHGIVTDARSGRVRLCPDFLNPREQFASVAQTIATCARELH
ncbi:MAG: aminotransferase class V-fold PLP-dependent enzyme [Fimbriimonadaceae bacterium]|nr:aminotransferase class V-fold PLP-dependent enzyme [Fimbriimonadaceae bacterium]QYK55576.1 MAG: aminotransferase class V-fold PLP-dependent enzyme [Fimbriimonadaceae bacterium]